MTPPGSSPRRRSPHRSLPVVALVLALCPACRQPTTTGPGIFSIPENWHFEGHLSLQQDYEIAVNNEKEFLLYARDPNGFKSKEVYKIDFPKNRLIPTSAPTELSGLPNAVPKTVWPTKYPYIVEDADTRAELSVVNADWSLRISMFGDKPTGEPNYGVMRLRFLRGGALAYQRDLAFSSMLPSTWFSQARIYRDGKRAVFIMPLSSRNTGSEIAEIYLFPGK